MMLFHDRASKSIPHTSKTANATHVNMYRNLLLMIVWVATHNLSVVPSACQFPCLHPQVAGISVSFP